MGPADCPLTVRRVSDMTPWKMILALQVAGFRNALLVQQLDRGRIAEDLLRKHPNDLWY